MTEQNQIPQRLHLDNLTLRAVQGAGLAAILLTAFIAFLFYTSDNDPQPGIWLLAPYFTVMAAGAAGGVFFYLAHFVQSRLRWHRAAALVPSILVYIFGLWLGLVAGLAMVGLWD